MAIAFFRVTERSQNAASKYDYDTRSGRYKDNGDLVASGNQNLPAWASLQPRRFWAEADKNEKGNKCKTIIIAMPKELGNNELRALAQESCEKLFPGHAVTWAIHRPKGRLSEEDNPHLHAMVCERLIDPNRPDLEADKYFKKTRTLKDGTLSGGYAKDVRMTKTDRRKWLQETKESWEAIANRHLKQHAEQQNRSRWGWEKEPEAQLHFPVRQQNGKKKKSIHLGPKVMIRMLKGEQTKIGQQWIDQMVAPIMQQRNREYERAKIAHTTSGGVLYDTLAFLRHPLDKKKRRKMLIDHRVKNATDWQKSWIEDDMLAADRVAAEALRSPIKQLNVLTQWGRENNVGDGVLHYPGCWPKSFASLAAKLKRIDEERTKAQEAERREAEWNERKKELAEQKAKEEAERKLQQKITKPVREPERQQVSVHTRVHTRSRGRGRSR